MYKDYRFNLVICGVMAMAISTSALANDGITLITPAGVVSAGGWPLNITKPGSYRLAANLVSGATAVINISADDVTLDLNGFMVSCKACSGVSGIQSSGVNTVIQNGTVTGFIGNSIITGAGSGISLHGDNARMDHITMRGNNVGVYAASNVNFLVSNSNVSSNASVGIASGLLGALTVTNSIISNNGQAGITMGNGLVTSSTIVGNGFGGTLARGGIGIAGAQSAATITNNVIVNNVNGIYTIDQLGAVVGYGSNTFHSNTILDVNSVSSFSSMKNNVCASGIC